MRGRCFTTSRGPDVIAILLFGKERKFKLIKRNSSSEKRGHCQGETLIPTLCRPDELRWGRGRGAWAAWTTGLCQRNRRDGGQQGLEEEGSREHLLGHLQARAPGPLGHSVGSESPWHSPWPVAAACSFPHLSLAGRFRDMVGPLTTHPLGCFIPPDRC